MVLVAPGEEPRGGAVIGKPRILVADRRGEEFEEPARGLVARVGDHARHDNAVPRGDGDSLGLDDNDGLAHAS